LLKGQQMAKCRHFDDLAPVTPSDVSCQACLEQGERWVHLRVCLVCGHVGCCDASKNKHATEHFHSTGHAVIRSSEPGERWGWCYVHKVVRPVVPDDLACARAAQPASGTCARAAQPASGIVKP
jgi:hypothetical protein